MATQPVDYEAKYRDVMDALRSSRIPHGDCNSGKRYGGLPKACTACMANLELEKYLAEYRGRPVRLASPDQQDGAEVSLLIDACRRIKQVFNGPNASETMADEMYRIADTALFECDPKYGEGW